MFQISLLDNAIDEISEACADAELYLKYRYHPQIPANKALLKLKHVIKHLCSSWELLMKYWI